MIDLSIAIPYHGDRLHWTLQTIKNVHNYPFIKEIVISPDQSDGENIKRLESVIYPRYQKVKILPISKDRLYVFRNKVRAVAACSSPWVALVDSDNIIGSQYINPFMRARKHKKVIFCPETGYPNLRYKKFVGADIDIHEASDLMQDSIFQVLLNTMNYIFHKDTWLCALYDAIVSEFEPKTADSMYINYNCLKNGMLLRVVRGCMYKHTVHQGSFYIENHKDSCKEHELVKNMLLNHKNSDLGSNRSTDIKAGVPEGIKMLRKGNSKTSTREYKSKEDSGVLSD